MEVIRPELKTSFSSSLDLDVTCSSSLTHAASICIVLAVD